MGIFFAALKIIGILLLAILVLLCLLLFHPVFYRVKGNIEEDVSVKGCFWWLFQVVRLEFEVENAKASFRLRLFGLRKTFKEERAETEESPEGADKPGVPEKAEGPESADKPWLPERDEGSEGADESGPSERDEGLEGADEPGHPEKDGRSRREKKKKARRHGGAASDRRAKNKKSGGLSQTMETFRREFEDERNRQAASHIWKEVLYLLVHVKPNDIKAELSFSAGDPALTGQVTGALSLLPVIYRYHAQICPDFVAERAYVRGSFSVKGHLALYRLAVIFLRVLGDKNIRRILNKLRKQEV